MPNGYTATDALAGLVEGIEQIPEHLRRSEGAPLSSPVWHETADQLLDNFKKMGRL